MRLLDLVSQCSSALRVAVQGGTRQPAALCLPGPADYAARVQSCALRYVLSDELVTVCALLAFADGDRLAKCLDLVHLPSTELWIEWSDVARDRAFAELDVASEDTAAQGRPAAVAAGALINSSADGRAAIVHTFWSDPIGDVSFAPMESHVRLDGGWPQRAQPASAVFSGGLIEIGVGQDDPLGELYGHMRFRMHPMWAKYYREAITSVTEREYVIRASLATVARDMPLVLAFALLLAARGALRARPIERSRLNKNRLPKGQRPLLDHVEVDAVLMSEDRAPQAPNDNLSSRRRPRLHRVRGHLLRRGANVYWRVAHLRGKAAFGRVKSRTVTFCFNSAQIPASMAHVESIGQD